MALILSNCESLIAKKNTYAAAGPSSKVNGAAVRIQVNPQGTAHGAMAYSTDRKTLAYPMRTIKFPTCCKSPR
ncbi:MAG: hypothetical protein CAK88_10875 [Verrucomicrobiia bacterium AMD-G2]|nr:MAG: hypothetical protein CAK88_10875 [Verrucomicrobiae bacterium AMD-G2]